ncbi:hypothetical protein KSS87_005399 [Heliosperma pusillum]|nr:hypothetical protein KSS87_005399 [Heliosperma pusillum]
MGNRNRTLNSTPSLFRNLDKADLGGVIFGCTDKTINECLSKQLFGLPSQHFGYVKNIDLGLPLFLFNYSKRELHGIYESASTGQMNIDPYGWTKDGSDRTAFPAQVLIRTLKNCRPLLENQFSPIIKGNYYTQNHFRFELDHVQASKLIALFSTQVLAPSSPVIKNTGNWKILNPRQLRLLNGESDGTMSSGAAVTNFYDDSNEHLILTDPSISNEERHHCLSDNMEVIGKNDMELIHKKLQTLAVNFEQLDSVSETQVYEPLNGNTMHLEAGGSQQKQSFEDNNVKDSSLLPPDYPSIITQLMLEVQELKAFKQESIDKMGQLEQKLVKLESVNLSQGYHDRTVVHRKSCSDQPLDTDDFIYLAGGHDGKSWLASLESYYPSKDIIKPLCPMHSARSYASLTRFNGEIYVIGGGPGGHEDSWYDTAECYNPVNNVWTSLPCLSKKKGSLAALTLHDKVFALGGGNGVNCFSDVEMLDLDVGRWICARSMLQKVNLLETALSLISCHLPPLRILRTVFEFELTGRFALASVELNGALYAVGGFDGKDYLSSGERFDPREHSWSKLGSMNSKRGCHAMVVLNEKLYAVGGFDGSAMVESVEVYDPRLGAWMIDSPMNYQRGYAAAAVLNNSIYAIGGLDQSQNIVDKVLALLVVVEFEFKGCEVERYEEGCGWQVTDLKAIGKRCFASAIV